MGVSDGGEGGNAALNPGLTLQLLSFPCRAAAKKNCKGRPGYNAKKTRMGLLLALCPVPI